MIGPFAAGQSNTTAAAQNTGNVPNKAMFRFNVPARLPGGIGIDIALMRRPRSHVRWLTNIECAPANLLAPGHTNRDLSIIEAFGVLSSSARPDGRLRNAIIGVPIKSIYMTPHRLWWNSISPRLTAIPKGGR